MGVFGQINPPGVNPSRARRGRGNPNGFIPGVPGQTFYDELTGQTWLKGGPSKDLGWFLAGPAQGNPSFYYGSAGQTTPLGVVQAAGPALWCGADGTLFAKLDAANDTSNWYPVITGGGLGSSDLFGSGAVDPFFGNSHYQMNDPVLIVNSNTANVTRLSWTVPDLTLEQPVANGLGALITIWYNTTNHFSTALTRTMASGAVVYFPPNLYFWGVTGAASGYTAGQLASLTAVQNEVGGLTTLQGAVLGSGHKVTFISNL